MSWLSKLINPGATREKDEITESADLAYNQAKSKVTIPSNARKVESRDGYENMFSFLEYFMWIENGYLCFFPTKPSIRDIQTCPEKMVLYKISFDRIDFFSTEGEVIHETKITGGGGNYANIAPIKSQLISHDNRNTILYFFDDRYVRQKLVFKFYAFDIFNELFPEKSFNAVNTIKEHSLLDKIKKEKETLNIPDRIRELSKLKNEGIITEKEFQDKKKEMLSKI